MIKPKALGFASSGETRWFVSPAIGFKVILLLVFLAFGVANQAGATLVNISFNDGHGDVGSGVMNITGAGNTFQAVGGYLDVTSGGAVGHWNLFTAGGLTTYPTFFTSPSGGYWYDNAVYPTGVNPQYPGGHVVLDYYGLLFRQANGNELNLWGNADSSYTLFGNINGYQNFTQTIGPAGVGGSSGVSISAVPEVSTVAAPLLLLGVFGTRGLWFLRKSKFVS
jgi:hypothetical protein